MKRLGVLFGLLVLTIQLTGCDSGTASAPPTTDPRETWPDEVKEAEARFEKQAADKAAKYNKPAR